jgi:hypothetical protein
MICLMPTGASSSLIRATVPGNWGGGGVGWGRWGRWGGGWRGNRVARVAVAWGTGRASRNPNRGLGFTVCTFVHREFRGIPFGWRESGGNGQNPTNWRTGTRYLMKSAPKCTIIKMVPGG